MFGKGKHAEERLREQEQKKRGTRRYGQARLKHSHMGVYSCGYAGGAFTILLLSVLLAFFMRGETGGYIGGLGFISVVLTILGIRAGIKGLRERDRNYITCKVGIAVNIIILLGLIVIFIGGF